MKHHPKLRNLAGGLEIVFPGTSTVEEDFFSIIGWEKDEYRSSLSVFSLEGIMHSKQYSELLDIEELINIDNLKH